MLTVTLNKIITRKYVANIKVVKSVFVANYFIKLGLIHSNLWDQLIHSLKLLQYQI